MAVLSFAPYSLLKMASRSCVALLEARRKQMAIIIRESIQCLPNAFGGFLSLLNSRYRQHAFFIYRSYHRVEFRGGNMKHIHQLSLTHAQVLQVGRNGKHSITVHGDNSPFHAIPPITGKFPLIQLSKTDMSWSSLVLVTLAYICVVVIFV